jgi:hypothetical protein
VHIDLGRDLHIGRDLQDELRSSMERFGWYVQLKEQAHAMMKQKAYNAHCLEEEIYDEVRAQHPRLSETQVKNKVHLDKRWRKRTRSYMRWRDRYRMLSDICVALKERNENLRTLESSERAERAGRYA